MPRTFGLSIQYENLNIIVRPKQYLDHAKLVQLIIESVGICVLFYPKIKKIYMNLGFYYLAFHDPIWTILLSITLFFPIRQLIWVLYVRKKQKKQKLVSEEEKKVLKKRATFTSIFLSIVFSYIYVTQVFN